MHILDIFTSNFKNVDNIHNFCINNKVLCTKNKTYMCGRLLSVSGYVNIKNKEDTCNIYKELTKFAKSYNNYKINADILDKINEKGSLMLKQFLIDNGYNFSNVSRFRKLMKNISDLSTRKI